MSGSREHWTTRDLELYHDEELDAPTRSELSEALRRDPELRERFATVCRVDDELRVAFLSQRAARLHENPAPSHFARHALAAACLFAAVSVTWWSTFAPPSSRENPLVEGPGGSHASINPVYQSIRVVLSLPVEKTPSRPATEHGIELTSEEAVTASENLQGFLARLDRALITGPTEGAFALLDGASERQRIAAYRRLGELLRSAQAAERILDRLSSAEQLAVCALWAREPVAQPTVFERLRRFSMEPELSADVRLIVAVLAKDSRLRTWLRGYQLVGHRQTRQNVSS